MVYPIIHDYPICLQCFIVTNIVSDTIWTYLDWLILHDAKKGQHLDQNLPPMAPLKTRHGSTRQSENLLSLGGIWFAMVCPTRIPQKWQAIKQTGIINLGKAMGTGLFPLHFQVRNPFEPSPKSSTLLRASPFTAACAAHMNVLFRLTQLHMCNSCFFQSGKRPQHGCPESPWNQ